MKISALKEVPEMFDSDVDCQKLTVVRTITGLCRFQCLREKCEWTSLHCPSMCCCRTARTAISESFVIILVGVSGVG